MTKQKSTKRALLMSALALLMCVSMLIGSTFAWFTDSVTSSGNKIKAGTLDIELWKVNSMMAETEQVKDEALFNYDLWEPGYAYATDLKLKNVGTLDAKFIMTIVPTTEVGELAEVIDVYYTINNFVLWKQMGQITGNTSGMRDYVKENYAKLGTLKDVLDGTVKFPETAIGADNDVYIQIAMVMQESAGNEYQGKSAGVFDLRILATQLTSEKDSFDDQYDKDAVYGDVMVSSDAELKAAIEDPAMKVIAVNGDLTYDWGGESYENSKALNMKGKTFLGANDAASITFAGYGSANPIVNATFKDITIKDVTKGDNESSWEHGYLEFKNLTAVNVTFANSIMMEGDFATFKNCSFNSNKDDEYAVWVANGDATFEGCTFTGPRGVKVHEAYDSEVGTVVIDNNTFAGLTQKPGVAIGTVNADTTVAIKDSKFVGCQAGDQGLYIYETDTDVTTFKFVNVNNKVLTGVTTVANAAEFLAATNGGKLFLTDDINYNNTDPEKQLILKATDAINFDGNGNTITSAGADPSIDNHGYVAFVPPAGEDATVSDLTVTGEGFVEVGDYSYGKNTGKGDYTINNLVVKDLAATLAVNNKGFVLAPAFCHYGNAVLNDCIMTGTTNMVAGALPIDAAFVNSTTTTVNGGEYGVVYCYEHANVTIDGAEIDTIYVSPIKGNVTIKAGTVIDKLVVDYGTSAGNVTKARLEKLVIENGTTINKIVYAGNTYTIDTWNTFVAGFGA